MMQNRTEKNFSAIIPSNKRIWAIGAVYGDASRLSILHQTIISLYNPNDIILYLGNLMGYGPDVGGVLDEVFCFRKILIEKMGTKPQDIIYLRGQQEEMWRKLLTLQFAHKPENVYPWMLDHGVGATIAAYGLDPEEGKIIVSRGSVAISRWTGELRNLQNDSHGHTEILNSLKHAALTDDGKVLFTSWSINPSIPFASQGDVLWWGSSVPINPERPYEKFSLVVRGESNPKNYGVHLYPYFLHINSAGGRGGPLLSVILEDKKPVKIVEL